MLSAFPYLLSYMRLGPVLIRLALAAVFMFWAYRSFRARGTAQTKTVAVLEAIAGVLLLIGLWTQVAALYAAIDLIVRLVGKVRSRMFLTDGVNYYVILLAIALALMVMGPGFLAFDLPL